MEVAEYFAAMSNKLEFNHTQRAGWATDFKNLDHLPFQVASHRGDGYCYALCHEEHFVALYYLSNGTVWLTVAARTADHLSNFQSLKDAVPEAKHEDDRVVFKFWVQTQNGPSNSNRKLEAPTWDEIRDNYSGLILPELDTLMQAKDGEELRDGRLHLWRGAPGTGKTYAIRAMARAWQDWCDFHFVVDPDQFFGHGADYMMKVIMSGSEDRWKILVLEDSGELLAADAKQQAGQGLSRLLNVVDGVLGQGLKLMVLVTTNEDLQVLHEAVTRNGRCASCLAFDPLTGQEAREWLRARDYKGAVPSREASVSELYAILKGEELETQSPRKAIGFA
jgi:hypothetical protein